MLTTDDIVAINQVVQRVHHLIDDIFSPHSTSKVHGQFDLMRQVFIDDVVYDLSYRNLPIVHGVDEFAKLASTSYGRDAVTQMGHHATNVYVYEDEDGTVRVASKVISIFGDGDMGKHGSATCSDFHDVVVRTEEGWRIAERVAVCRWPNPTSFTREDTLSTLADLGLGSTSGTAN